MRKEPVVSRPGRGSRRLLVGASAVALAMAFAGPAQSADQPDPDSTEQAAAPTEWTSLPGETWYDGFGCSLAVRTSMYDGYEWLSIRAGNHKDYLGEDAPAVVRFYRDATGWVRDGPVAVGSPKTNSCPFIASAGDYDVTTMWWGDVKGLFITRWIDPITPDTDLLFPPPGTDFRNQWPGTVLDVSADGTVVAGYSLASGAPGVEVLRPSGNVWSRVSLPIPDDAIGMTVSDDFVATTAFHTIWIYRKADLGKDPVPYQAIAVPASGAYFSAMDSDGARIVVGADNSVPGGANSAHVITLDGNSWRHTELPRSDYADGYGTSVAIDGNRIVVGAPYDNEGGSDSGSVYLYEWDGTRWQETKIPGFLGSGARFGWSVAVSGQTLAVGAPGTGDAGTVMVATLPDRGAFIDDDGNTFEADIEWLANSGITRGCNPPVNDRFCPDDYVTRGQMAAFLHRALGGVLTPTVSVDFVDDDGSTFENDIEWLGGVGVTRGCNPPANDRYCPDDYVTRGQMAAFLVRALGYTDNGGGDLFLDDDGNTFENDIDKLGTAGVTRGCNPPANDRFCPNDYVTRGQMAAFLHRALGG